MNKRIEGVIPDLAINGIPLERVKNFNFLGLLLNENIFRVINDKTEICNKFNHFFASIGPKLATQIKSASNKTYDTFLKKTSTFVICFHISKRKRCFKPSIFLTYSTSAGIDGISVKLLEKIKRSLNKSFNIGN